MYEKAMADYDGDT